ncbi:hypothetical protein LEP1GSC124_2741 [Leptospira interrogans serovar Pyrogenes str. 200701872]|uniref:Uncharacterized protein n=1 Tax=Leptospira interrogans serovar Pyrogenes str. 200701872 TaxID=1193029 RepID=M6ZGZ2_LEPIR|nr:hypothetical protein LEP1GSC124_2741 [Leptospira interrogans serovar Pyrogenes str. 200701872]
MGFWIVSKNQNDYCSAYNVKRKKGKKFLKKRPPSYKFTPASEMEETDPASPTNQNEEPTTEEGPPLEN